MATSPTSTSAAAVGAAKDDAIGVDGIFHFTYEELLRACSRTIPAALPRSMSPSSSSLVTLHRPAAFPALRNRWPYLAHHGITAHLNVAGTAFVSFDIGADATDIKYFVQIGNKGTWSQADVDVTCTGACRWIRTTTALVPLSGLSKTTRKPMGMRSALQPASGT